MKSRDKLEILASIAVDYREDIAMALLEIVTDKQLDTLVEKHKEWIDQAWEDIEGDYFTEEVENA